MVMTPPANGRQPASPLPSLDPESVAPNPDDEIIRHSVVATNTSAAMLPTDNRFVLWLASVGDGIQPWGRSPKVRDAQLRNFVPEENWFISALGSVCAANAGFSWKLDGPDKLVVATQEMLLNSNRGKGWEQFVIQVTNDLLTQDLGAYVEVIRNGDGPTAPVINVAHLDAARCWPTGNVEIPVIYQDRLGRLHGLRWYQVIQLHEMPSAVEHWWAGVLYTLQYSAITRLLRAAQIMRSIAIYNDEKLSGRFQKAVHVVRGVTPQQIKDALTEQTVASDQMGLLRYIQPLMVGAVDPKADVGHDTIELAAMPEALQLEPTMKWYLAAMALAFLRDYQDFAPLPGGGLGTAAQSEVLHAKARGKGPELWRKLIQHMMNFGGILPRGVTFEWDDQDVSVEQARAQLSLTRAQTAQLLVTTTGILDEEASRQQMLADGELSQELYDELIKRKDAEAKAQAAQAQKIADSGTTTATGDEPADSGKPGDITATGDEPVPARAAGAQANAVSAGLGGRGGLSQSIKAISERVASTMPSRAVRALEGTLAATGRKDWGDPPTLSAYLQTRIHRAFTDAADDLAGMGYLDTEERIELSGAIGDALRLVAEEMQSPALAEATAKVLDAHDVRELLKLSAKDLGEKATHFPPEREKMERELAAHVEDALAGPFARVRAAIEKGAGKKAKRSIIERVTFQRDGKGGPITGAETERWED